MAKLLTIEEKLRIIKTWTLDFEIENLDGGRFCVWVKRGVWYGRTRSAPFSDYDTMITAVFHSVRWRAWESTY